MARSKLSRRTMLRGILAGAAVGIGLPLLDIFVNDNGDALAQGSGFPKRFGVFFWGNGMIPSRWDPDPLVTGSAWQLTEQLMPLAAMKQQFTLVTNTTVKTANSEAHIAGAAGIFTGSSPLVTGSGKTFAGPSLDQYIADRIGNVTRYRSIETTCDSTLGFTTGTNQPRALGGHSYTGPNARIDPEFSPHSLFNTIFGPAFVLRGDDVVIDPTIALRQSVLDVVTDDIGRLRPRLGSADRIRLDGHLEGVRRLELRLAGLQAAPPDYAACARPAAPPEDSEFFPVEGRAKMSMYNRAFTDILAMALACDQTRVMSHWFSGSVSQVLYPGTTSEHHALTHDEKDDQPQVNSIVLQIMTELAYMLETFANVPEGAGSMLDNMLLFATSDCSLGRTHQLDGYPIIIAGKADGNIVTNQHINGGGENASKVVLAMLHALEINDTSWGTENGVATQPLPGLLS
jgi:hypothetical protein